MNPPASLREFFLNRPLPRGVVFDLDDTLYLQAGYKRSAFAAVGDKLASLGVCGKEEAARTLEEILSEYGASYGSMFDRLAEKLQLDPSLVPVMVETLRSHKPVLDLFPGVREMLAALHGRVRLGLLTDGLGRVQRAKVDALDIARHFDLVVFSDDHGTKKPDQLLFALFEDAFGLAGSELAYVADDPGKDFVGANERGWTTVRVRTGEHGFEAASGHYEAAAEVHEAAGVMELFS